MKKIEIISLGFILIVTALLRFPLISQGFFAFTYDQGRDLLEVAEIVENKNLTLIGPTTGLPGIFYGPWWYYFLSPLYFLSQGNVQTIALTFAAIGEATIVLLYLLTKKATGVTPVALTVAAVAAMSQPFITSSSQIWSPSLVLPLMLAYVFSLYRIFQKPKAVWFLVLGISSGFIADSGAAFGIVLTVSTFIAAAVFRKNFLGKNFLFFLVGLLLVLLPRIIFDIRNDFLITKSILSWILAPNIYQEKLPILERAIARLDLFYLNFAQTFAQSDKVRAILPFGIFSFLALTATRRIMKKQKIQGSPLLPLFKFLFLVLLLIYLLFTIYPDAVWDYYLAGLPAIFIFLFVLAANFYKRGKILVPVAALLLAVNFQPKLLSPFSITWQGDGAIWRNQIRVIEDLKDQLRGQYSLHIYSPAGFDYPFAYIIGLYHSRGQIDLPQDNQKIVYLIIRDDTAHSYMPSGWYGDKTRDNTKILEKKEYAGNIIVEKHQVDE